MSENFDPLPPYNTTTNAPNLLAEEMARQDEIPLQQVVSHGSTYRSGSSNTARNEQEAFANETPMTNEKLGGLFHRHTRGRRKLKKLDSKGQPIGRKGSDGEEDTITWMGKFYDKFTNFSIITRYSVYVVPVGLAIAVPIIVGATAAKRARIGGITIVWFFTWIEMGECLYNDIWRAGTDVQEYG